MVFGLIFEQLFKIHKKSNFDRNQFKLDTQHKYVYMYQKKYIKMENSLVAIFDEMPCTIVHGLLSNSNFDQNQLIDSTVYTT